MLKVKSNNSTRSLKSTPKIIRELLIICGVLCIGVEAYSQDSEGWKIYHLNNLESSMVQNEFLSDSTVSGTYFKMKVGTQETLSSSRFDRILFVNGVSTFIVEGKEVKTQDGDVLYVRAGITPRISKIEKELKVLAWPVNQLKQNMNLIFKGFLQKRSLPHVSQMRMYGMHL